MTPWTSPLHSAVSITLVHVFMGGRGLIWVAYLQSTNGELHLEGRNFGDFGSGEVPMGSDASVDDAIGFGGVDYPCSGIFGGLGADLRYLYGKVLRVTLEQKVRFWKA